MRVVLNYFAWKKICTSTYFCVWASLRIHKAVSELWVVGPWVDSKWGVLYLRHWTRTFSLPVHKGGSNEVSRPKIYRKGFYFSRSFSVFVCW